MATDVAEIVGGAIALQLLFDLPLLMGALITAVVSTVLLLVANHRSQRSFERVITGLLAVVAVGFVAGSSSDPARPAAAVGGPAARLAGTDSALLAVGMLGATVMPHAVYLHAPWYATGTAARPPPPVGPGCSPSAPMSPWPWWWPGG